MNLFETIFRELRDTTQKFSDWKITPAAAPLISATNGEIELLVDSGTSARILKNNKVVVQTSDKELVGRVYFRLMDTLTKQKRLEKEANFQNELDIARERLGLK